MSSILLLHSAEMRFLMKILMLIRYFIPSLMIDMDEMLCKDLERWKEIHCLNSSDYLAMARLLWRNKEFRNLVIFRNRHHAIRRRIVQLFYPPMDTLYIDAFEIGGSQRSIAIFLLQTHDLHVRMNETTARERTLVLVHEHASILL